MKNYKVLLILLVASILLNCTSTRKLHEDWDKKRTDIKTVTILPPQMEFIIQTATLNEPKPEFNDTLSFTVEAALTQLLRDYNFEVGDAVISDSILMADQELARDLTNTFKKFAEIASEIVKENPKYLDKKMNPEIGQFADRAAANYIFLIKGVGFGASGGAVAKDIAIGVVTAVLFGSVGVRQYDGLILEIAIVDANTAEVIFYNRNTESDYMPLEQKDCRKLLARLLKEKVLPTKSSRW